MNNIKKLKSTSDGWRGILAETFDFKAVEMLGGAIAGYTLSKGGNQPILIGYDTRFIGRLFAERLAAIFMQKGIETRLTDQPIPTPLLSFRVNQQNFFCGVSITASHNPYHHNGMKLRMGYGGPPSREIVRNIESHIKPHTDTYSEKGPVLLDSPVFDYVNRIRSLVEMECSTGKKLKVLVDPMHGTTAGFLKKVVDFRKSKITVKEIHSDQDPYFGGIAPEPKEETTAELQIAVERQHYDLGIAHDGDGDRITAALPGIGYMAPHEVGAILLWYMVTQRKMTGLVLGTVTLGRNLNRLTRYFGLDYMEIPVGFYHATNLMRTHDVLMAVEENGGIGFGFHLPERDAILSAGLLVEAACRVNGGILSILENIRRVIGTSACHRLNVETSSSRKHILECFLRQLPEKIGGGRVVKVTEIDGIKLTAENGDWVCLRSAGTEELIRVYTESDNIDSAKKLGKEIKREIEKLDRRI